jgi:hypothetical protein
MKKNDRFLERLQRRKEQASSPTSATASTPPERLEPTEELPTDPEARAAALADELRDARQGLERERKARQQVQRQVEQQARPSSLGDMLRGMQVQKRRTWR